MMPIWALQWCYLAFSASVDASVMDMGDPASDIGGMHNSASFMGGFGEAALTAPAKVPGDDSPLFHWMHASREDAEDLSDNAVRARLVRERLIRERQGGGRRSSEVAQHVDQRRYEGGNAHIENIIAGTPNCSQSDTIGSNSDFKGDYIFDWLLTDAGREHARYNYLLSPECLSTNTTACEHIIENIHAWLIYKATSSYTGTNQIDANVVFTNATNAGWRIDGQLYPSGYFDVTLTLCMQDGLLYRMSADHRYFDMEMSLLLDSYLTGNADARNKVSGNLVRL